MVKTSTRSGAPAAERASRARSGETLEQCVRRSLEHGPRPLPGPRLGLLVANGLIGHAAGHLQRLHLHGRVQRRQHRTHGSQLHRIGRPHHDHRAIREDHECWPMEAGEPAGRILAQVERGIALERGLELRRHQLGEVLPHPLRLPLLGLDGNPHERHRLRHQHHRQQDDEAETDAPVQAAIPAAIRHRRTCSRFPRL